MLAAQDIRGNPLKSRADGQRLLHDLMRPLLGHFSPGHAQVRLGSEAAHFDQKAAWFEGFARPLWALAPLHVGGGAFEHWDLFRQGMINGTDPKHAEYWELTTDFNQRSVEIAALGFAMALAPEHLWVGLTHAQQSNLAAWVRHIETVAMADNNWHFFPVMAGLGLENVGVPIDLASKARHLQRLEEFYRADGWYGDGIDGFIDHYNAFAIHFYGLIYARHKGTADPEFSDKYKDRATAFAQTYQHWFGQDGSGLIMGRSLTYRFAMAAFWGALAYANVEALPWGQIRGLWARNMRWWMQQPCFDAQGLLPVGFTTPNYLMSEEYNSPGSPYWAFKAFLPFALSADHPFWTTPEEAIDEPKSAITIRPAKMLLARVEGDVIALPAGPPRVDMRNSSDKYAKFAYSSRFGLCVEADRYVPMGFAGDNILAFALDAREFHSRRQIDTASVEDNYLKTTWRAGAIAKVTTLQTFVSDWELRVHKVEAARSLFAIETGHAVPVHGNTRRMLKAMFDVVPSKLEGVDIQADDGHQSAIGDYSNAGATGGRNALLVGCAPNTNLCFPQASVPALVGRLNAGTHVLQTAVFAQKSSSPRAINDKGLLAAFAGLISRAGWDKDLTPTASPIWRIERRPAVPQAV